ncbi:IclR family transcriptional regulator [Streptomyces sp. 8L]|uniref:IclR family transcriptional regulator n=1 Tax=Streptomyces sp. 8L TaxID=2877242 RepID=UPI001CD1FC5A|nr:IclR family transcriptional regulator [Streptomyces sp. 8L]MCA1218722.1 IclR family transcriptional regulator [Streptomyces sp. 8L]
MEDRRMGRGDGSRVGGAARPTGRGNRAPDGRRKTPAGGASVTSRALSVLAAFSPSAPVLKLTDIACHAGLPLTTAHRLVSELRDWGALERDPDGGYRIGLRLWEIAALAPRALGLRELALPYLSDLGVVTRENVQLAVREQLSLVFVERLAGQNSVHVLTRVGGRFALPPTGVGRVLLAHAPADVQEEVLARPQSRFTEHTVCDPAELRRCLAEVRRTGVAVCARQVTLDGLSVAAPVRGPGGDVVAAVSVVAHIDTVRAHTLVPLVQVAARGISRALGAPPGPPVVVRA